MIITMLQNCQGSTEGPRDGYNRCIRTPAVAHTLGEPARRRVPTRTGLELLGANINVLGHGGRTLALVEGGITNYEPHRRRRGHQRVGEFVFVRQLAPTAP